MEFPVGRFETVITDPLFYVVATIGILLVGISKGGFGGGLGMLGVPMMALVIDPILAAAILLPILCMMDVLGVWAYRRTFDRVNLMILVPAAFAGTVIGTLTFKFMSVDMLRLMIGLLAVWFTLDYAIRKRIGRLPPKTPPNALKGGFWGTVAGFTSFIAHAGGPPLNVYMLPQRLDKTLYVGTTVILFFTINWVKLIPYSWLGLFDATTLLTALILLPLAPVGIYLGIWLHSRIPQDLFYTLCYGFLFATGCKLLWDGSRGILGVSA